VYGIGVKIISPKRIIRILGKENGLRPFWIKTVLPMNRVVSVIIDWILIIKRLGLLREFFGFF
jgi:hypothetical protein